MIISEYLTSKYHASKEKLKMVGLAILWQVPKIETAVEHSETKLMLYYIMLLIIKNIIGIFSQLFHSLSK